MIDLRSDTVTAPTPSMRRAMFEATVGDDVYGDDTLTQELEQLAAAMTGKEAAVFVPSGTFANQLALLTHTTRSDEVIVGNDCHIIAHEAGASALIAGVQLKTLTTQRGVYDLEALSAAIRAVDIHYPVTRLICMENAHGSGSVVPLNHMQAVYQLAQEHGIAVHLDGARLFNAATALGVSTEQICQYADSINICLSKGLCAPIGSVLTGTREFIEKARFNRKKMGGGMRQTGILAAAGIIALKEMSQRLKDDHIRAEHFAKALDQIDGIEVVWSQRDINMVFFKLAESVIAEVDFVEGLKARGILINGIEDGLYRFVTHYWVDEEDLHQVVRAIMQLIDENK